MPEPTRVNDRQSRLNATSVAEVFRVTDAGDVRAALASAAERGLPVSTCGGRHAMGGQQFVTGGMLLDTEGMNRVTAFDPAAGTVTAEAGIFWPRLMAELKRLQAGAGRPWVINQKQTGVDAVSLGGSLSANAHGRGLRLPPMVADVEAFELIDAEGTLHRVSRTENAELFGLAIGGYGLFGVIMSVTLRLVRRRVVRRVVEAIAVGDLIAKMNRRIADGHLYGDCQYATYLDDAPEEHPGILSSYAPVAEDAEPAAPDLEAPSLSAEDWADLIRLARTDKRRAFAQYTAYYLKSSGRIYGSDTHQLSPVFDGYRTATADVAQGTEMITEVYADADAVMPLLAANRRDFRDGGVDMTYGTIRFIEPDTETFLPWATRRRVCVVVNLHVKHTPAGRAAARDQFRRILDRTVEHGGSFYLTYHRWFKRRHLDAAYPQMADFLRQKRAYDPAGRFRSDFYTHLRSLYPEVGA